MGLSGHHEREMLAFRQRNSASCIAALRDGGTVTLTELSRITGLSRPTVESIVLELTQSGLAHEEAEPASVGGKAGRPARRFSFSSSASYAASVDLGLHSVTVIICNLSGTIVSSLHHELSAALDGNQLIEMMGSTLREALALHNLTEDDLSAVVVCVTGIVDDTGRILQSNVIPEWNGIDLASLFGEGLSCPVLVENDVNMAAVGEMHSGAAQHVDDVVYVMVGHRISAAIVLNRELHRGRNFAAGEVGDLEPTGWGFEDSREISALGSFLGRTPEDVFAAAEHGDATARGLVQQFARRISRGIAVVGLTVDPDLIVIGGGLSSAGPVLLRALQEEFTELVKRHIQPPMVFSTMGSNGVALGGLVRSMQLVSERVFGSREIPVPPFTVTESSSTFIAEPLGL